MFYVQDSLERGITINASSVHEAKYIMTFYSLSLLLRGTVTIQTNKNKIVCQRYKYLTGRWQVCIKFLIRSNLMYI